MPPRPSPATSALKALHRARVRGPAEVLGLGWRRGLEALRSDDELIVWSRSPGREPLSADWELERAAPEDAAAYARDIGTDSAVTFRKHMGRKTTCYVVRDRGRLVHASWVTMGFAWTRELRAYVQPPEGHAYVYESYTRPEVRGRGVYPFALAGIATDLTGTAELIWVMVEADNPASVRAVTKAGFGRRGSIHVRRRWDRLTYRVEGDVGLTITRRPRASGAHKQSNP